MKTQASISAGPASLLIAACFVMSANAADVSVPPAEETYVPPAEVFSWSGLYFGVNGNFDWGTSRWKAINIPVDTGDFAISGQTLGATAGFNVQNGNLVFGLEGDIDWTNINGNTPNSCSPNCETFNTWLATGRARLGLAMSQILFYVTGGVAAGDVNAQFVNQFTGTYTETRFGWAGGGGVEIALNPHWSVKAEYLHVDLGNATCPASVCVGPGVDAAVKFVVDSVRAGVNLHF